MGIHSNIQFIGFSPNYQVNSLIQTLTERVSGRSPSDSIIRVILEGASSAFKGNLRISSLAGVFEVKAMGTTPELVMKKLSAEMLSILSQWRTPQ